MKDREKILHNNFIKPNEYPRILHTVVEADFNTNHPNPYRIDRIASEIQGYLKQRNKLGIQSGGDMT